MKKSERANYIKALIVLVLLLIGCTVTTGCASWGSDEIIDKDQKVEIADKFEMVYGQDTVFYIYRHVPTDMMYVTKGQSIVPMGLTYEEYIEKSRAFHAENDKIIETETESKKSNTMQ